MKCVNCGKDITPETAYRCNFCGKDYCEICAETCGICQCYGDFKRYS